MHSVTPRIPPYQTSSPKGRALAAAALLLLLPLAAYLPTLWAGFVWDDDQVIVANPLLRNLHGLVSFWFAPSANKAEEHYWPLVYSVLWLEYQAWGLWPAGYHLVNVLVHAANGVLLWRLLQRLGVRAPWMAAAVFALHPVHVESVAWVIELKDVLSALFYLLAFHTWLRFVQTRARASYACALLFLVCGLLCKSVVVTLPAAMALCLWWKREYLSRRNLLLLLPFAAVAAFYLLLDFCLLRPPQKVSFDLSLAQRLLVASHALWFYTQKLLWPYPLMAIYPRWHPIPAHSFEYLYPVAVVGATGALWATRQRLGKAPLAAWLFFALTLSPTLGLVWFSFMSHSYVADRFQYLASMSILTLLVVGVARLLERRLPSQYRRRLARTVAAFVLALLGTLTWAHAGTYRSMETLFTHNARHNPRAWGARYILARQLLIQGKVGEAAPHYHAAFWGTLESLDGMFAKAVPQSEAKLRSDPQNASAHYNLALAQAELGRLDASAQHFEAALAANPRFVDAYIGLAAVLMRMGHNDRAVDQLRKAAACEQAPRPVAQVSRGK